MTRRAGPPVVAATMWLLASGCGDHFAQPAYHEALPGDYEIMAFAERQDMAIWRRDLPDGTTGRIPPTVCRVGWDNRFIIAAQHPRDPWDAPRPPPDKTVTNWYIIRMADDRVFGPFTESEFAAKRGELRVPDSISFTRVFDDLD